MIFQKFIYKFFSADAHRQIFHDILTDMHDILTNAHDISVHEMAISNIKTDLYI